MPTTSCPLNDYFVVDPAITPEETRHQMYAALVAAMSNGVTISVGYDSGADCTYSRPWIYAMEQLL